MNSSVGPGPENTLRLKKYKLILIGVLALALFLRITHWLDVREDPFTAQLIMDSFEYDRWAQEIAAGNWVGDGVFFQAPLYPYILAVLFSLFGHNLDLVYLFQAFFALAGIYALYRTGRKLGGEVLGLTTATLASLYGVFIFYDIQIMKESLAVSLACFLLWNLVEAREGRRFRLWMSAGVLSGLLCLLRENMLLVFPLMLLLVIVRGSGRLEMFKNAAGCLMGLILVLSPVAVRNGIVGGVFSPTTFQGGVNYYIGNNPDATGTYQPIVPGKQIPSYERNEPIRIAEQSEGRHLSTAEVSQFWLDKALSWAVKNPVDFVRLQLKKLMMFWSWYEWPDAVDYYYARDNSIVLGFPLIEFGGVLILALLGLVLWRKKIRTLFPIVLFVLAWMMSTVLFFLFSRYRLPVVPALLLLAALPLSGWLESFRKIELWKNVILVTVLLLVFAFPHFAGFKPRMDLVFYNLALIHEDRTEWDLAEKNYTQALKENPDEFLPYVNLGNIAVRKNDWPKALEWFKKAAEIEPESEGVHSNLGGAYVALGQLDRAEHHFDKALEINPDNIPALHNKAILQANRGNFDSARMLNERVLFLSPRWQPALNFQARLKEFLEKKKTPRLF